MRGRKGFYVLVAVTLVVSAAAVMFQRPAGSPADHGPHAPDLLSRVDDVQRVVIRTPEMSLPLERTEDGWLARSKDDYPANAARIRQLVLGISHLERLDRKTADPGRLHRLELRGIDEPGSAAVQIELLSAEGERLASLLVGKTEDFQQAGRSRYYVRDTDDPQSWLVEGSLPPVLGDAKSWLQRDLLPGLGPLRSVTVTHADGSVVSVRRGQGADADYQLDLADGEEIDNQYSVNTVAETLGRLSLDDVRPSDSAGPDEPVAMVEAVSKDGVRVTARIGRAGVGYEVWLEARHEPDQGHGDGDAGDGRDGAVIARDLNRLWRGRSFVVSQYALDGLLVRRADLLKAPETG